MKILSNTAFQLFQDELLYLRNRVFGLEKQNAGLIDRLLIEKGQIPLDENLGTAMQEAQRSQEDLFEQLTQEEVGEESPDDAALRA